MAVCSQCGRQNADDARFCAGCAAPLIAESAMPREVRKVVTVLFSDVVDSTPLGERLDPESLRQVMARWHEAMRTVLERHGGMVEKFVGDAVMAVFGLPVAHEDDALRASRAATQMRVALSALNVELAQQYGVRIESRTAFSTGEVVAGIGETLVTGDAVNTAARLEQHAQPGEILIGEQTFHLVRDVALVEPVARFALKGKSQPVSTWRLLGVLPDAPALSRPITTPFVGRERELALLGAALEGARSERSCELVTVLGLPGIGKSRLLREFASRIGGRARILVGRCLPYGEGITYWPLVEIVKQLPDGVIAELFADDERAGRVPELLAGAVGSSGRAGSTDEIHWAVRKLFEALAAEQELVVILEDLHWAEPTFLDLVEYIGGFSADAPILILASARPELVEDRPAFASPYAKRQLLPLEPLAKDHVESLIEGLMEDESMPGEIRARLIDVAEGNPLFVEQLLAMQAETGSADGEFVVPPTLKALLAARIDRLQPLERSVIERAAVEGRGFHRGAVAELVPPSEKAGVGALLLALVRKELIRPDRSEFAGDDGFRFVHMLVRDAAYESIPKQLRASLHARLAGWLEARAGEHAGAYEEIIGYHFEQAYGYLAQLGPLDDRSRQLGAEGARRLAASGSRALARGDDPAAAELLRRATRLLPEQSVERLELLPQLAEAIYGYSTLETHDALFEDALGRPGTSPALEARLRVIRMFGRVFRDPERAIAEVQPESERALPVFEAAGDDLWLAKTWRLAAWLPYMQGRAAEVETALRKAVEHARRAGDRREELHNLLYLVEHARHGTIPAGEGLRRCDEIATAAAGVPSLLGGVLMNRSAVLTMLGRFDEASASIEHGRALLEELGLRLELAYSALYPGMLELARENAAAAVRELEPAWEVFSKVEGQGGVARVGTYYGRALYELGQWDEAEGIATKTLTAAGSVDLVPRAATLGTLGRVLARRGEIEDAQRLVREAMQLADRTDWLALQGAVLLDLADVLNAAGKRDAAATAVKAALDRYERKQHIIGAARARAFLIDLGRVRLVAP
jgi:class 3 adenylate cyclase/tetratricopeptide (TPR) repeat protein